MYRIVIILVISNFYICDLFAQDPHAMYQNLQKEIRKYNTEFISNLYIEVVSQDARELRDSIIDNVSEAFELEDTIILSALKDWHLLKDEAIEEFIDTITLNVPIAFSSSIRNLSPYQLLYSTGIQYKDESIRILSESNYLGYVDNFALNNSFKQVDNLFESFKYLESSLHNELLIKLSNGTTFLKDYIMDNGDTIHIVYIDQARLLIKETNSSAFREALREMNNQKYFGKALSINNRRYVLVYVKRITDISDILQFLLYHEIAHHVKNSLKSNLDLENEADCYATELLAKTHYIHGIKITERTSKFFQGRNFMGDHMHDSSINRALNIEACNLININYFTQLLMNQLNRT